MKGSILVSIAFILTTATLNAQNAITPSKIAFDKKWIKNESTEMVWYSLRDTTKIEMAKVATSIIVNKKGLLLVTEVKLKSSKGKWIDSSIATLATLQPKYHASYNMQRDMVLHFGKVVTGFYNNKMKKQNTIISDTTTADYFDSNLYPALIRWLPLTNGYKESIAIYDYNPVAKIGVIKANVTNVTTGEYASKTMGTRAVWVVTVSDEIGNGVSTYYIDKADRKLWQQSINAGGRKMLMQVVEQ